MYDGRVFEDLAGEIDELEIPPEADALAEVLVLRSRLDAALATAVARFREAKRHTDDGATSTTAWVSVPWSGGI